MKKLLCVFVSLITVISLASCASEKNVEFYPDAVKYNLFRSNPTNEFSFNINVISSSKNPEIEFISAKGVEAEYLTVTFSNDTFDYLLNKKFDGKYVILLGVHCTATSAYTEIQSMKLSVDGNEREIVFSTPIKNTFSEKESKEHCFSPNFMPTYIFPQSFVGANETDYEFSVTAVKDATVNSFGLSDFLELSGAKVYINDELKGKPSEVFPLNLKQGDLLTVKSRIKAKEGVAPEGNFYLNIVAECECNGEAFTEYYPLSATFICDTDSAEEFVKLQQNK